jgi:hypothetical protein
MEPSRTSSHSAESSGMKFLLRFGVAALATWRVTHLLAREDGPAAAIARVRETLGDSQLGELMDCFQCASVWVAVPFAFYVARKPADRIAAWLALSGAACLLEEIASPESRQQGEIDELLWKETSSA